MPVYVGINWHKLVFDTDWQKLGLCRHFANPGRSENLTWHGQWRNVSNHDLITYNPLRRYPILGNLSRLQCLPGQ